MKRMASTVLIKFSVPFLHFYNMQFYDPFGIKPQGLQARRFEMFRIECKVLIDIVVYVCEDFKAICSVK